MSIEFYASWNGITIEERDEQEVAAETRTSDGQHGFVAAYSNEVAFALRLLCRELFEGRVIPAREMRDRLPAVLERLDSDFEAQNLPYSEQAVASIKDEIQAFVAVCERKESETGAPVRIYCRH
jgi:hypothetical protein